MISKINYSSIFIWLALDLAATANIGLFILLIIFFFEQRQALILQPQTLPTTQILNSPSVGSLNHLPQLQDRYLRQ
jgi:hypothetical protein